MEILHPSGEAYDLPAGAALEITRTNPFFNETGEQSLPVSLPLTAKNKRLLGYINRTDLNRKPEREITVIIRDGIYQQPARQVIFGVTTDAIDTTFYFRNGDFYTRLKNLTMSEVFCQEVRYGSIYELNQAYYQWCSGSYEMLSIFPIAVNDESNEGKYKILNRIDHNSGTGDMSKYLPLYNITARTETRNDGSQSYPVDIPAGYYITPFVRVKWMLKTIFSHIGFTLNDNRFLSDPYLSELVVLNNTADAVASLSFVISDLLPAGKIADFLDILRQRFRCEYILKEDQTVDIRFLDDILRDYNFTDLSNTVATRPSLRFSEYKRLHLTQESTKNIYKRVNYSDFIEDMKYVQIIDKGFATGENLFNYLCPETNNIIHRGIRGHEILNNTVCNLSEIDMDDSEIEQEEVLLADPLPESVEIRNEKRFDQYPYVGDYKCIRSVLTISGEEDSLLEDTEKEKMKWMLCFNAGTKVGTEGKWKCGSVDFYDESGVAQSSLRTIGVNGLYNKWHRSYDILLRNTLDDVEIDHIIPESVKNSLSGVDPVMINNQPLLPNTIDYVIGAKTRTTCKWKSLRITPPINLPTIPEDGFPQAKYYWKRMIETDNDYMAESWQYVNGVPDIEYFPEPTEEEYKNGGRYHNRVWDCVVTGGDEEYIGRWFTINVWLTAHKF